MSGNSGANAKFAKQALDKILSTPDHPLSFLVDRASKSWLSRAAGVEDVPAMQVGHMVSKFSGALERLALEDADRNQWANWFGETHGVIFDKQAILIGDIPIMLDTAMSYERMGKLPSGTCALAQSSLGWSPRWGMAPDQAPNTTFQPLDSEARSGGGTGIAAPAAGAAGVAGGTGVAGLLGGLALGLFGLVGSAAANKSASESTPPDEAGDHKASSPGKESVPDEDGDDGIPWCIDSPKASMAPAQTSVPSSVSTPGNYTPVSVPTDGGPSYSPVFQGSGPVLNIDSYSPWPGDDGSGFSLQSLLQDGPDTGIAYGFLADLGQSADASYLGFNCDGSVSGYNAADSLFAAFWTGDDGGGGFTDYSTGPAWVDSGPGGVADGGYGNSDY